MGHSISYEGRHREKKVCLEIQQPSRDSVPKRKGLKDELKPRVLSHLKNIE